MPNTKINIFHQERSFNPFQSPLGRLATKLKGDWLKGENYYILYAMAIAMVLMFANQVAWTFVKDAVVENPAGATAIWYWGGQLIAIAGFVLLCFIGFRNSMSISFDADQIKIGGSDFKTRIDYENIETVKVVTSREYHRIYRPYKNTQRVFNKMYDKVIILRTSTEVFAFSMPRLDHDEFLECVNNRVNLKSGILIGRERASEQTEEELDAMQVA